MEKVTIRIERRLLEDVRTKFPELKEVSDTDVVRVAIMKLLSQFRKEVRV